MSIPSVAIGLVAGRGSDPLERTLGAVLAQVGSGDSIWVTLLEGVEDPWECAARVEEARAAHGDTRSPALLPVDARDHRYLFESAAAARNEVIGACNDEIVAFLDDGGIPLPGWLEAIRERFADPGVDAVAGRLVQPGLHPEPGAPPGGRMRWTGHLQLNYAAQKGGPSSLASGRNCAVRRLHAVRLGGFDEAFTTELPYEDVEFFTRIGKGGGRTWFLPEASVEVEPYAWKEERVDPQLANLEEQAARTCAMAAVFARHEAWALLIMGASHLIQTVLDVISGRLPNIAPLRIVTEIGEGIRMGVRPVQSRLRSRKLKRR